MDSGILRNDFLILSFSLSALALLYGSFRGCKAIKYILREVRTIKRDKKNGKELTEQDMPIIGKYIYRTRAIIGRSWLEAALEY